MTMQPKTEIQLIKVLEEIASELNNISTNTSNINIELEQLNSKDISGSSDDCTSDIAKNIADIGLELNNQLSSIVYCLDEDLDEGK